MIVTLAVENYRSLRRFVVPLTALTAVTGANGTGKSSLYRSLRLLADAAHNGAVAALARVRAADVEPVAVRLHPEDLRALGPDPELPEGARLVADPSLSRGDAVADLPDGWLDARIGTALERARTALETGGAS